MTPDTNMPLPRTPGSMNSPCEPIEAVLLDVGGPVYDDVCYVRALLAGLGELAGPVDEKEFREVYDAARQRQSGGLRRALAERFVPGADRDALTRAAARHWEYSPDALYHDVLPTLSRLHGRYRIALVANQRGHVRQALARDGVEAFVDSLALSEDVGVEKPDPGIFQHALNHLGVPATRAVHVGNRLDTDVRGAQRVGLRTVWVLRGEAPPAPTHAQLAEPDAVITSLSELSDALEQLQEKRR